MAFTPVPSESKSQINKAGKILVQDNPFDIDFDWALNLADRWRACHAYPINTFQATLRNRIDSLSSSDSYIVAQRLKRMPTIIDKLKRYPAMQLTTMQDIGGVRAVLGSCEDVYRLTEKYENSGLLIHELIDKKDYIQNPRSSDGYRSMHLIYKYKNKRNPNYNGLRLELQIRTKLQHTWATAVETMGTFLGQALKSRQGSQEWLDFFAIISSAFSHIENRPPVPRYGHLSCIDTFQEVRRAEARIRALEMMQGISVAAEQIIKSRGQGKSWSYHLIVLNSLERTVQITAYDRENFEQAASDYSKAETDAVKGQKIEPVLVSAGPIDTLRRAYPNFFLDIGEFTAKVREIISEIP
ncbi:MAG: (p)ppGpp synthetase [Candidatus Zixiibacteriota bacterium]|nr:MAG: (p)ppGpp synthetase [candidate division Zixibacteria bacterium]